MVTVVLFVLTIVLILAAGYVGLLILRRSRPDASSGPGSPRTVGDLVRKRTAPPPDLSGKDLFAPTEPRRSGASGGPPPVGVPAPAPDGARSTEVSVPGPTGPPASTPPGGVEAGDAPWRRAARMMGSEPGGKWETAPLPVVPPAPVVPAVEAPAAAPDESERTAVMAVPHRTGSTAKEAPAVASTPAGVDGAALDGPAPDGAMPDGPAPDGAMPDEAADEAGRTAVVPVPAQDGVPVPVQNGAPEAGPDETSAPETAEQVPVAAMPAPDTASADTAPADPPSVDTPFATSPAPAADRPTPTPRPDPDVSHAPSRPLSDPEMTPLMGIPIVRPVGADAATPAAVAAVPADLVPAAAEPAVQELGRSRTAAPAPTAHGAPPAPVPATQSSAAADEEVVWMPSATAPHERAAVVTGSPQPVWFRVVDRNGEPVAGGVVSLLDDHGREADVTKTATDGGGELHAPHSGRFLMIVGADRFQPRAALLSVEEQPVEIALLLPRSARVAGTVRGDGAPLAEATVIARQEGEVVDEIVTDRDGNYRFDDLAEGTYALFAAHDHGGLLRMISLSEGADLRLDLDLVAPAAAR